MTKLNDVNTTDLRDAIEMGCDTMCNVFNADDDNIAFFGSRVRPEARLSFSHAHSEAHIPGRHLNALLNAETAAGVLLDEDSIDRHAHAAFFSYSGPTAVPLNREQIDGPLRNFLTHNIREGFHALYALATYRGSQQALDLAVLSIETILQRWNVDTGWDSDYFTNDLKLHFSETTFISGIARAIGPLVKLYRSTAVESALELAMVLADKTTSDFFSSSGAYDRESFGSHTHSVTCVMSSLAQLADLRGDLHLLERVRAFYDNGLWKMRDNLGWVIENSAEGSDPDRGEINNTGDIVETALILGRHGYSKYFEDAERILRGHLLPAQLRDVSFIRESTDVTDGDGQRDLARRHRGAFGFPAPYGHEPLDATSIGFNMDIVGGGVASLCEVLRNVVTSGNTGHWVNLFFDHRTPAIEVESPYTHSALRIRVKQPGPLFVRRPSWLDVRQLKVVGPAEPPRVFDDWLLVAQPPLNRFLTFSFPLPDRDIVLLHRSRQIRTRLRGDEVTAMENFGADLTFFDPFDHH